MFGVLANHTEGLLTPESPQRFLQQGIRGSLLWGVDFPGEGAVAANPSSHRAKWQERGGGGGDGTGEHVYAVDQARVETSDTRVESGFEDEVDQEDRVGGAGGLLPDDLDEESIIGAEVVRGQNPVFVGAGGGRAGILLGNHIVKGHAGWVTDAKMVLAE